MTFPESVSPSLVTLSVKMVPMPTSANVLQLKVSGSQQTCLKQSLSLHYYRRYLKRVAETNQPLQKAIKIVAIFSWTAKGQDAFETLKSRLTITPILPFFMMNESSSYTQTLVPQQRRQYRVKSKKERSLPFATPRKVSRKTRPDFFQRDENSELSSTSHETENTNCLIRGS